MTHIPHTERQDASDTKEPIVPLVVPEHVPELPLPTVNRGGVDVLMQQISANDAIMETLVPPDDSADPQQREHEKAVDAYFREQGNVTNRIQWGVETEPRNL